jgi:hypothetical protein
MNVILKKDFTILFLTTVIYVTPTLTWAEVVCEHDILGLRLGLTKEEARGLMLNQGFREIPVRRNSSMKFTNKKLWQPAGIKLNRQQLRLASMLQDPNRKKALEKRAETDPALKKRLAELPTMPQKRNSDVIDVRIVLKSSPRKQGNNDEAPIAQVYAEYRFPTDTNGREIIYSPSHQKVNQARWIKYCSDVDVSGLRDHRVMDKKDNQIRICKDNPGASGHQIQVSIQAAPIARKHRCSYMYIANPLTSSEYIK